MKTAVLLFTYNRSRHTEYVINALSHSNKLPEKLLVFQDGMKSTEDKKEWNKVNKMIKEIDWCDTEIHVAERNKGLVVSITSGITYAFQEYDAVIVLEDDCVPAVSFINFMEQCFEKYKDNKEVYSVSGYAYPVSLKKDAYDVYGCGRISSWGWGTWKDRWGCFRKDYELAMKMKQNETASRNLAMWGAGLEEMLVGNIKGICNSWAVFWALNVIAKNGVCINPYEALIKNIGFDGSGTHITDADIWDVELINEDKVEFSLPDELNISDEIIEAFAPLCGSYTALNRDNEKKEKILVYGMGNFFKKNERDICRKYYIKAIIDHTHKGWYAGKKIITRKEISHYTYDYILIMIFDAKERLKVIKELMAENIERNKILVGKDIYE